MLRNLAFAVGCAVSLMFFPLPPHLAAADFGTPEEAKAMLERASGRGERGQSEGA